MINTVTEWSANITTPESAISPDNFEGLAGSIPPNNFVISRNKFGKIASIYSDNEWNFKAYNIRGTPSTLYFNSWFKGPTEKAHLLIIQELKLIMFSYIWYRHGKPYSVKYISRLTTTLNILALFAFQKRITVVNLLQSKELLAVCIQDLPGGSVYPLQSFLRTLITIGADILGFLPCSPEKISGFQSTITQYRASLKQHPPIPSRIYSLYITKLQNHLSLIEQHIDRYIELIQLHESNTYNGLTLNAQKVRARKEGKKFLSSPLTVQIAKKHNHKYIYSKNHLTLDQLITSKKLDQFFDQYPIKATPHGLASGLVNIQFICKTIIHLFSGMRHSEVRFLPFNCASSYTKNGVEHSIIRGYTTKFNEKETEWITNKDGIKAINIAKKIALYVCDFLSINPNNVDSIPLFISPAYTGIGAKYIKKPSDKVFMPSLLITSSEIKRTPFLHIKIEETDIRELEHIDPFRAWREEQKFEKNAYWTLHIHQFRRSLALYASCSGIVSLPSLRRQLQHVTEKMSLYYAKGSSYAIDLISNDKYHFANEYQATQPISQSLAYIANTLLSKEKLFGIHGTQIEKQKKESIISENDRANTISQFKKGEISYQETFLGGCTTTTPCQHRAMRSITACLNCDKSIIKKSQLERVIKAQTSMLKNLDPTSLEYRTERSDLKTLKNVLVNIQKKSSIS